MNASVTLDDLGDRVQVKFPEDRDYDTLGGFLYDRFDEIPSVGQWIVYAGRRLTVKALEGNRIAKVHIAAREAGEQDDRQEA